MTSTLYIIGQILGIAAVILGSVSMQMKSPGKILFLQIINAFIFSAHYLLIGAYTAISLNLLAGIQCIFYYFRDKRQSKSLIEPIVFTTLMIVVSILTWEDWYSVFIMVGLAINSASLAFPDAQMIRISMFLKSPACLLYNIFVLSGGGIIYECAVLISAVIGLIRNRSDKPVKTENA